VVCKHRTKDHNKFWLCFFEYVIALQTHKSKVHRWTASKCLIFLSFYFKHLKYLSI
jgi:hypothetical protein